MQHTVGISVNSIVVVCVVEILDSVVLIRQCRLGSSILYKKPVGGLQQHKVAGVIYLGCLCIVDLT